MRWISARLKNPDFDREWLEVMVRKYANAEYERGLNDGYKEARGSLRS